MNYFKFKNNEETDNLPEIVLQAGAAADKILLYNILNGTYGTPVIKSGSSKDGMTNEVVIAFENAPVSASSPSNQIEIVPEWTTGDPLVGKMYTYTEDEPTRVQNDMNATFGQNEIDTSRTRLFFNIVNFDNIKDFSPKIIVERYKGTVSRGAGNSSPAGFRTLPNRVSEIALTDAFQEMEFEQEKHFRWYGSETIAAKGSKRIGTEVFQIFQFRVKTQIGDDEFITPPLVKLKLCAVFLRSTPPNTVALSYKIL